MNGRKQAAAKGRMWMADEDMKNPCLSQAGLYYHNILNERDYVEKSQKSRPRRRAGTPQKGPSGQK